MGASYRVVWTEVVVSDLEAIIDSIAAHDSVERACLVHARILEAIDSLLESPRRRFVPELLDLGITAYRETLPTPYRVMFRIDGLDIVLMGIFDGRRSLEELLILRAIGDLS